MKAPRPMTKMATGTIWIWQSSHTNCMFHILQEVGAELNVSNLWGLLTLDL